VTLSKGEKVALVVTSDVADEIHLHGYDLSADVAAGGSATIRFTADTVGRFEVELEERGVQLAELQVTP
jgi:heme/copper-type cytochrome/quinol oxidase subunit 2